MANIETMLDSLLRRTPFAASCNNCSELLKQSRWRLPLGERELRKGSEE